MTDVSTITDPANQSEISIELPPVRTNEGEGAHNSPLPQPPQLQKKKLATEQKPGTTLQTKKKLSAQQIDNIVHQIIAAFPDGVNVSNLMEVLIKIMTLVKDFANLGGTEKKELVVDILCHVIDETDSGDLEVLDPVIKMIIPHAIDLFIETEKGRIKFTTKKFKRLCPCIRCQC